MFHGSTIYFFPISIEHARAIPKISAHFQPEDLSKIQKIVHVLSIETHQKPSDPPGQHEASQRAPKGQGQAQRAQRAQPAEAAHGSPWKDNS